MYKQTDKKKLYWLIDKYLLGEIDERTFCEEFYYTYNLELNSLKLTNLEYQAFHALSKVSNRFSELKQDHQIYPGLYYTEKELRGKIIETKKKLNKTIEELIKEELKIPDPSIKKSATILDDIWLMCPDCIDAWESTSKDAMVICPKCNQVLHNPRYQNEE